MAFLKTMTRAKRRTRPTMKKQRKTTGPSPEERQRWLVVGEEIGEAIQSRQSYPQALPGGAKVMPHRVCKTAKPTTSGALRAHV
jgi:hypothetical protein